MVDVTSVLHTMVPHWVLSNEAQSMLITTGLLLLGWILLRWAIQCILSVLWPVSLLLLLVVAMGPDTAQWLVRDVLPPCVDTLRDWMITALNHANSTFHSQIPS
ncbi:uncharacterized protein [Periplaneta americana]|uniref:uncharacterized protein isoform X2 n=1 Tax=Periplaneta americana TaxID=6978 RepID=UPI0037E78C5A